MSSCLFCNQTNVYIEDVFGINRLLITIYPETRNNCILKIGSKTCIKCFGKITQLEKFVTNFRNAEYNDPDCCSFCGSEQVFQSSIEPITEAVLKSKLWTKEAAPLCCGACYWQIDHMTQLKSQLESITLTLKFKLKPATVSLLRFTDEKIISEQEALKVVATSGESSKKRQSNVKVEELHLDSTESSSKRKSVNLNKSPSNLSTVLKEIKTETPKTKGAKKSFDDGENPMTTDIPEVPESSTSFEKKKRARKMTKKLIKKMLDLHGLTECYVKAEKLSDEDIAHHLANLGKRRTTGKVHKKMIFKFNKRSIKLPSSSSGPSTSSESIFPDEDIFEEPPKIAIPQNGLSDLIPQQKKGRGRPAKSAALSLSLLGPDKSTESILPDDFVEISLSQLSKVAINGRSKRSPKLKGTPNKTKSSTVSSNRDIYGMDPMSEITKVGNSELEPEQITGILSYLKKHKRSSSTSPDEKPQIVPKLEIKPEIVLETDKTNHIVQNGESPPPDPMLSSAADPAIPCKVEQICNPTLKSILKMDNNNHHVLRNISFADTDEIYIIKDDEIEIGSGMGESLADLTPEPLPTKNNIFSETINIDFVNGELPETNYKSQKIEYEELSSETILLD